MELEVLKDRRLQLENDLYGLLLDFTTETKAGIRAVDITCFSAPTHDTPHPFWRVGTVEVTLDL